MKFYSKSMLTIVALAIVFFNGFSQEVKYPKKLEGYLFAYFEGSGPGSGQEQLRFATSVDGINWFALNQNNPVIKSDTISYSGGIRDPHILRKEDASGFYITATDMNTHKNGWAKNTGIVMLKSPDLTRWSHKAVDLAKEYPATFSKVKWVWAPQTIYDPIAKKYLVYFTIRFEDNEKLDFYCAYANKDFTGFEKEPTLMFSPKFGGIDGDIIFKDGIYHFFYKGNTKVDGKEVKNGIQQATSRSLQGPWVEDFKYLDAYAGTDTPVEGSSIFKLNNSPDYVLMYDLYTKGRYEYQKSTDLFNFSDAPLSFTKNFFPRHGSVIGLSGQEARYLNSIWKGVPGELLIPKLPGDRFQFVAEGNPIITHQYTADPAAMVDQGTLWLFTGHDAGGKQKTFKMEDWSVFSTTDMKNWTQYPVPLKLSDFSWAKGGDAYAGQVIKRNGKYYWYISTNALGIGVAVSDRPEGPYKDAIGKPLLTNKDCYDSKNYWACIDPTVFVDKKGQGWIFWGNSECYYAKLKENMIEIDGAVKRINFEGFNFTEAPWIHEEKGTYYLSYATGFPEKIAYATSKSLEGPWKYQGILNEVAGNSDTNHQAIVKFKNKWYFFYHNGAMQPGGGSNNRSVCIDEIFYNKDGTLKRVIMTSEGVGKR